MTHADDPILFLSGAGLAPWIWDVVRAELNTESAVAPRPQEHTDAPLAAYVQAATGVSRSASWRFSRSAP